MTARLFAFTTQNAESLRSLLAQRSRQLLGCNHKSKTVQNLTNLEQQLSQFTGHTSRLEISSAIDVLDAVQAQGFVCAARVLKDASPCILPEKQFTGQAERALTTLKQAFAQELDFYRELVRDPALVLALSQAIKRLK